MKNFCLTIMMAVFLLFCLDEIQAQITETEPPKAGSEYDVLDAWVGVWTIEGEAQDSINAPYYHIGWTLKGQRILNGFAIEIFHQMKIQDMMVVKISDAFRLKSVRRQVGEDAGLGTFNLDKKGDRTGELPYGFPGGLCLLFGVYGEEEWAFPETQPASPVKGPLSHIEEEYMQAVIRGIHSRHPLQRNHDNQRENDEPCRTHRG
jgi:hypothetical protein